MRIVGGTARGRPLLGPPEGLQLRPTSDKVREAVFDVLSASRRGAVAGRALDLFAGTGAFGIEALSRGASEVVFVEKNRSARALIRENLRRLGFEAAARIVAGDVLRAIARMASAGEDPFDLAFVDPPYGSAAGWRTAEDLVKKGLLSPEGIVVIESSIREAEEVPPVLETFRCKRYGDTRVAFLRPVDSSPGASRGPGSGNAVKSTAGASS